MFGRVDTCGQLTIINRAIAPADVKTINFYLNPRKEDWGSTSRHSAEKGMDTAVEITVKTTTLGALFDQYGVPYYLKSDIEGADPLLVRQLMVDPRRPTFVSIETYSVDDLNDIAACGFERFQFQSVDAHLCHATPSPPVKGWTSTPPSMARRAACSVGILLPSVGPTLRIAGGALPCGVSCTTWTKI